jgi:hypothetical protein
LKSDAPTVLNDLTWTRDKRQETGRKKRRIRGLYITRHVEACLAVQSISQEDVVTVVHVSSKSPWICLTEFG